MLSFGCVAVSTSGTTIGEFEAVLAPLEGAVRDDDTMAFWHRHPAAWAAATEKPQPATAVIAEFVDWVRSFSGEPIFTAHPLALDGVWFDHYLRRFTGRALFEGPWVPDRLFRHPPMCLMSFIAGRTGRGQWECDVDHYPPAWLGSIEHTHRAIDDARGYANLLGAFCRTGE